MFGSTVKANVRTKADPELLSCHTNASSVGVQRRDSVKNTASGVKGAFLLQTYDQIVPKGWLTRDCTKGVEATFGDVFWSVKATVFSREFVGYC